MLGAGLYGDIAAADSIPHQRDRAAIRHTRRSLLVYTAIIQPLYTVITSSNYTAYAGDTAERFGELVEELKKRGVLMKDHYREQLKQVLCISLHLPCISLTAHVQVHQQLEQLREASESLEVTRC